MPKKEPNPDGKKGNELSSKVPEEQSGSAAKTPLNEIVHDAIRKVLKDKPEIKEYK